jgi:TRAP-type uncharacterized transport system fused permease subunit
VALSAYASVSVFQTDPIRTGVYAAKVALPKYLLGFSFILAYEGTALLLMPLWRTASGYEALTGFLLRLITVSAGAVFMAAATVGYARRPLRKWECWAAGLLSVSLFAPFLWVNAAGFLFSMWFFLGKKPETAKVS